MLGFKTAAEELLQSSNPGDAVAAPEAAAAAPKGKAAKAAKASKKEAPPAKGAPAAAAKWTPVRMPSLDSGEKGVSVGMTEARFQLRYCGENLPRPAPAEKDPRVLSFNPDQWQREVGTFCPSLKLARDLG